MAMVRNWQYKARNHIGKIVQKMSWKNREKISRLIIWLRDKAHIVFDGISPCIVRSRQEKREIDDDRYYDIIEMVVFNIVNRKKYIITDYK